ncbi:MAG: transposase [Anaerolineae bacterium]|nr:transposase [Anaerolineae bacterium]
MQRQYPQRKPLRLKDYDYRHSGLYFVTVCTYLRASLFGVVQNEAVALNWWGRIVEQEWLRSGDVRTGVYLDAYVVMPNHFHGIIGIADGARDGSAEPSQTKDTGEDGNKFSAKGGAKSGSLGAVVGQFKSMATRRIWQTAGAEARPLIWQRGFHDHIIRNEEDLSRIRQYVTANPARWREDSLFSDG